MKKVTFILVCTATILMSLPFHEAYGIDFSRKGIKGGFNISNYTGGLRDYENGQGFCIGAFLTLDVFKFISFQPELLYTLKGGKIEQPYTEEDSPDIIGTFWWKEKLEYLEIPLLLRLSAASKGSVNGFLLCGPAMSVKLSATYKIDDPIVASADLIDVNKTDFSMIFGGGLEFRVLKKYVSLEARYVMGLTEFTKNLPDKHRVISAIVGISF